VQNGSISAVALRRQRPEIPKKETDNAGGGLREMAGRTSPPQPLRAAPMTMDELRKAASQAA
jgi:hypothetical protein